MASYLFFDPTNPIVDVISKNRIIKKADAKNFLRRIAQSERVTISRHCRQRMLKRGISMDDILNALFWGEIIHVEHDPERHEWQVEVKGNDLDGDELVFHGAFYDLDDDVICITVY